MSGAEAGRPTLVIGRATGHEASVAAGPQGPRNCRPPPSIEAGVSRRLAIGEAKEGQRVSWGVAVKGDGVPSSAAHDVVRDAGDGRERQ